MADWPMSVADLPSLTTLIDDTQQPNGACWSVRDTGDGTAGWFFLSATSTATIATGKVIATQSGTGRWIRVGLAATDIPGEVVVSTTTPDPTNPDGWSIHCQNVPNPAHKIIRVWDGTAWLITSATPIHGEWGSVPPTDGAMPGHTATDYTNRVRYEWMDDLGSGYTWVSIGTF